ncbi:hypothetical protein HN419_07215 [Candidatus Woesearchaeota archaeon]|nr:hypothetical protein [Candidatus Woesearchaeota archaeon]MBT3538282.1 hypothetical protein [Candidatus Woesearchaeota archaeon]MBT4698183.1 hypothetical protein [Candidatus Woesearchaeota archaeon]MBT7105951.1 hypothetical protein [Candidatus Woesearchaeota archaeon]MBT7930444.1 hypothetical protein [Candidatus Woesearchaeota archaeon]
MLALLLVVPSVFAIDWGFKFPDLTKFLASIGAGMYSMLSTGEIVFGFTVIFFFVLLYGILGAALGKVNIFKGGSGGLNKSGKLVAVSMAFLSLMAIFVGTGCKGGIGAATCTIQNTQDTLFRLLAPFGVLGGLLIAIVTFLIIYKGFENESGEKSWKMGLAAAGLAMITAGMLMTKPNIMWWGWLMAIIAGIFWIIGMFGKGGNSGGDSGGNSGGSSGGNSGGSSGGNSGGDSSPGAGGDGKKPGKDVDPDDKEPDLTSANANYRPTQIQVMDLNGEPVKGANVKLTPYPKKAGFKKLKLPKSNDRTGPDGTTGSMNVATGIPYGLKVDAPRTLFRDLGKIGMYSALLAGPVAGMFGIGANVLNTARLAPVGGAWTSAKAMLSRNVVSAVEGAVGYLSSAKVMGSIPFIWAAYRAGGMPNASSEIIVTEGEGTEVITVMLGSVLKTKLINLSAAPKSVPADNYSSSLITAKLRVEEQSSWRRGRYTNDMTQKKVKFLGKFVEITTDFGELMPAENFDASAGLASDSSKKKTFSGDWWKQKAKNNLMRVPFVGGSAIPGFEGGDKPVTFRSVPDANGNVLVRIKSDKKGKATITAEVEGTIRDQVEVEFMPAPHLNIDAPDEAPMGTNLRATVFVEGEEDYRID